MTFEEFLAEKVANAQEYACGITADEEDIARDAWEAATKQEREACARVCDRAARSDSMANERLGWSATITEPSYLAEAIRARGTT